MTLDTWTIELDGVTFILLRPDLSEHSRGKSMSELSDRAFVLGAKAVTYSGDTLLKVQYP